MVKLSMHVSSPGKSRPWSLAGSMLSLFFLYLSRTPLKYSGGQAHVEKPGRLSGFCQRD